jgi:F0F1-type ATP synthase membrane subunit b/b'
MTVKPTRNMIQTKDNIMDQIDRATESKEEALEFLEELTDLLEYRIEALRDEIADEKRGGVGN